MRSLKHVDQLGTLFLLHVKLLQLGVRYTNHLVKSPLSNSLETRLWRHWKASSGDFCRFCRVSSGLSLKKTGNGPEGKMLTF